MKRLIQQNREKQKLEQRLEEYHALKRQVEEETHKDHKEHYDHLMSMGSMLVKVK